MMGKKRSCGRDLADVDDTMVIMIIVSSDFGCSDKLLYKWSLNEFGVSYNHSRSAHIYAGII